MGRASTSLASKIEAANTALLVHGDLDAIAEFFSPKYVAHITGKELKGSRGGGGHGLIRRIVGEYRRAFSNLKVEVEILVEARDRVAWQRTLRATHKGAFKGFPASGGAGRRIVWRDMVTSRFRNGLIVEDWVITDLAERLLLARKR